MREMASASASNAPELRETIARVRSVRLTQVGVLDPRSRPSTETTLLVSDPGALEALREALVIDNESLREGISLTTPGDLDMHFFDGHELLASLTLIAPEFLRWPGWPSDARLREPERLVRWLRERGWSGRGATFRPPSPSRDAS